MKKYTILAVLLLLTFSLMAACSTTDDTAADEDPSAAESVIDPEADIIDPPEGNGIVFEQEAYEGEIESVEAAPTEFFGTWVATSDKAAHLYGNVEVTVNADGTWKANITDENLSGKWAQEGNQLHMNNDMFSFDLAFDKDGNLLMIEKSSSGVINTVLTKK